MPRIAHPDLETPADDTVIWRYMDFAKFVQLLEHQALWLARADTFEDPLEGTFTDFELASLRASSENFEIPPSLLPVGVRDAIERVSGMVDARSCTFVSCWRMGDAESLAMWDLYGKGPGVVAIKSTVGRLRHQLEASMKDYYLAAVRYIDWANFGMLDAHIIEESGGRTRFLVSLFCRKDLSYQHEAELRVIAFDEEAFNSGAVSPNFLTSRSHIVGQPIPMKLIDLVTSVVVGPRERSWIQPLLVSVLGRYGLSIQVAGSDRLHRRKFYTPESLSLDKVVSRLVGGMKSSNDPKFPNTPFDPEKFFSPPR
jgi:hypothetical protein